MNICTSPVKKPSDRCVSETSQKTTTPQLAFGDRLLFSANDGVHGRELWITDEVNVTPSFTEGPDQIATDLNGPTTVTAWAKNIIAGPLDEGKQTVSFAVVGDSNPNLFAEPPSIDSTGTLSFTPVPNVTGTAQLTIILHDDGGTANGGVDTTQLQSFTIGISLAQPLHNRQIAADVTGDTKVVAEDAVDVINYINAHGSGPVMPAKPDDPPATLLYDVTGDDFIAADDVVTIINYIHAHSSAQQEAGVKMTSGLAETNEALLMLLAADSAAQSKRRNA